MKTIISTIAFVLFISGCGFHPKADGVKCGNTTCGASEYCCSGDWGDTGTCTLETAGECAPEQKFFCDGREDCPLGYECCIVAGNSMCRESCPALFPDNKPYTVCHTDDDCPADQPSCKSLDSTGNLKVCR